MNRVLAIAIGLLPLAIACGAPATTDDSSDQGGNALINGKATTAASLPGIVYLKEGCTATKVAPRRILTAAHCALDPATTDPKFKAGDTLSWSLDPASGWTDAKVAALDVHPAWVKGCEDTYCAASSATQRMDAPDVAVFELADDLAGVTAATVSSATLAPGDAVVIVGYGCTAGVLVPDARTNPMLEEADTTTIPADQSVHDGSAVKPSDVAQVAGIYSLTPGPGLAKANAGLCPGDSGGPLYAKKNGAFVVVGVNSNYTFRPDTEDTTGLPVTNWHTRLDASSRHDVASWLASVGVTEQ